MSSLETALYQLKFTAKQLGRQSLKAAKEEQAEKTKLEKAMKQGRNDVARIHAQNAVRKQTEKLNLLRLQSRVDAVASRVQTANTMRQLGMNMTKVNRSLDIAMKSMNPERIATVMVEFERQIENLDATSDQFETVTDGATATSMPQDGVDLLMAQTADKVGVELSEDLESATPSKSKIDNPQEAEDNLSQRLRALMN